MRGAVGLPAQVTGKFRQEEYRCVSDTLDWQEHWEHVLMEVIRANTLLKSTGRSQEVRRWEQLESLRMQQPVCCLSWHPAVILLGEKKWVVPPVWPLMTAISLLQSAAELLIFCESTLGVIWYKRCTFSKRSYFSTIFVLRAWKRDILSFCPIWHE